MTTDHAKQLAEEFWDYMKLNPSLTADGAVNWYRAKCLTLMAENERLRDLMRRALPSIRNSPRGDAPEIYEQFERLAEARKERG